MHLLSRAVALALAIVSLATANSITFRNQDGTNRRIVFTANAGLAKIEDAWVAGYGTITVSFPHGWVGNFYSVSEGQPDVPGMLGEVAFDAYAGSTFFDVSAIVNPNDMNGVKEMFPAYDYSPVSGCKEYPCNNAYYLPDDVQTKSTPHGDLICTLGSSEGGAKRSLEPTESANVGRDFVLGKN